MSEVYDPYAAAAVKGKNSTPMREEDCETGSVAAGQLRAFIERIERVQEEKKALSDDEKAIYAELKASGFDSKAVRTIIRLRKQDTDKRQAEAAMVELYWNALGEAPLFGALKG